ncbi:MAG: hypothetical protein KDA61_21855, partial [Planctomycetales bacterium]|nr:hypothetical protein [Planctomycetales bacterium]
MAAREAGEPTRGWGRFSQWERWYPYHKPYRPYRPDAWRLNSRETTAFRPTSEKCNDYAKT